MSGGRIEVGVGAGWNEIEHQQLGLAFPPIKERADLMEDQLAILHGLWGEPDGWSYEGVSGLRLGGRPVPSRSRSMSPAGRARPTAGHGRGSSSAARARPRSYRLAARYADEFNLSSSSPARAAEIGLELDAACAAIGRDPATLARSTMAGVLVGRTDAEVADREAALLAAFGEDAETGEAWLDERRTRWVYGTPDAARAQVQRFADAGIERIMFQDFLPWDMDMIDVMGEELVGRL